MRLDLHVHSRYSDGMNTVEEIVSQAKRIGLGGIAVTDHNTIAGGIAALEYATEDFKVISGVEVSSKDGHILVLDVREDIERGLPAAEVIEKAHELGGIAVAAHPFDRLRTGVGDLIFELDFDAVEVLNGHTLLSTEDAYEAAEKAGLPKVGGSDAHSLAELGFVSVELEGDPVEAIVKGRVEIISHVSKRQLVKGMLGRRFWRLL